MDFLVSSAGACQKQTWNLARADLLGDIYAAIIAMDCEGKGFSTRGGNIRGAFPRRDSTAA